MNIIHIVRGGTERTELRMVALAKQMGDGYAHTVVSLQGGGVQIPAQADLVCCYGQEAALSGGTLCRKRSIPLVFVCAGEDIASYGRRARALLRTADCCIVEKEQRKTMCELGVDLARVRPVCRTTEQLEEIFRYVTEMARRRRKGKRDGVVICGAYGHRNTGDDAILDAIIHEIHQIDGDMPIFVTSRKPEETRWYNSVQACHTFNFPALLSALCKAKLFISGGGSLIQNTTSNRSLFYYLFMLWLAHLCGCRVMMYGCGIGPVTGGFARWMTARVIDRCVDVVTLRDDDSKRELARMGVTRPKIVRTADPTVSIQHMELGQTDKLLERLGIPADGTYIGFGLREWRGFDRAAEEIARAAQYAWETHGMIPVFVPIEYPGDCEAAKKVIRYLRCPYYLITEHITISETISVLSRMSIVVGVRLHSLIFAAENGVPSIGISYDMKVDGFLRSIAREDVTLHIQDITGEQLMQQIDRAAEPGERSRWEQTARQLVTEERGNLEQVRALLEGAQPAPHKEQPERGNNEGTIVMEHKTKKRIAIFQSDLHVGGIQKSLVNLMSLEAMDRYEVDVYLFERDVFFDLSSIRPHIRIHYLKSFPYFFRVVPFGLIMKLMPRFKFASDQPYDVAIDFSNYQQDCAFGALTIPAKKRVMWIHNDMEIKYHEEPKYRILWRFFHSKFQYFSEFVAVSDGIIQPFRNRTGLKDAKVTAIPNLIDTGEIFAKCKAPIEFQVYPNKYNIASMGRLCHQKGYDILLDTLGRVCKKRKDLACYILGDGPDREALEQQARKNGLENVVHFLGNQTNPFPYLDQMDAFYLESRYEGQGMVLWEAKTLGLRLIFPKRLEKSNLNLKGTEDIEAALLHARREPKEKDDLHEYNDEIVRRLIHLMETD